MSGLCQPGTFELKSQTGNIELTADKVMIRQLLGILLDNAVKYTGDNKKNSHNAGKNCIFRQNNCKR